MSDQQDNTASRLYEILVRVKKAKKNRPCLDVWSDVLDIPRTDNAKIIASILDVAKMPNRMVNEFRRVPDIQHERYLRWYPALQAPFENLLQFNVLISHFLEPWSEVVVDGVWICSDLYRKEFGEVFISYGRWKRVLKRVRQAIDLLKQSLDDMDVEVHRFLMKHLLIVEQSLIDYQTHGMRSVVDACEVLCGLASINSTKVRKAKETATGRRVARTVGLFFAVVAAADSSIGMIERVSELYALPGSTASDGDNCDEEDPKNETF